ncbi:UPF0613 protein PB24D3.06c-like protein, partial [Drosera capensis]
VAFKTGDYKQQVIFVGGLTDGLMATDYLEPLAIALDKEKWSLVQALLSSSYIGYGTSSLEQDAAELDQLISYLINKKDSEGVVLLGHSTGCQDIVHYMRTNAACSRAVRASILQAPVSDREYRANLPETAAMIDLASAMISEGRGSELMPREANPDSPITAYRYHSLCAYMGDDDMFSSDLSDDQLRMRLGHMENTPCQEKGYKRLERHWRWLRMPSGSLFLRRGRKLSRISRGSINLLGVPLETRERVHEDIICEGPVLSDEIQNRLDADFTVVEVKDAVFAMGNDKASGPDGYTSQFFKAAWDIIGSEEETPHHPTWVMFSMADEYVPDYVDKKTLVSRYVE